MRARHGMDAGLAVNGEEYPIGLSEGERPSFVRLVTVMEDGKSSGPMRKERWQ